MKEAMHFNIRIVFWQFSSSNMIMLSCKINAKHRFDLNADQQFLIVVIVELSYALGLCLHL